MDGNVVEPLVDDEQFISVARAIREARRTIDVSQLLFFPGFVADGRPLAEDILDAGARGVRIRILLNENAVIPDTCAALERYFSEARARNVELRRFPLSPNVMHAKIVVVDGEVAFLPGSPFQQKYWDSPAHRAQEARRDSRVPLHDVGVRVQGPAVAALHAAFADLWNLRGVAAPDARSIDPAPPPAPIGGVDVDVIRSLPPRLLAPDHPGDATLLEAYLAALGRATRFVYIETQYFTSPTMVGALKAALDRAPRLQMIIVLNEETDILPYNKVQVTRVEELGHPHHPRLGIYTLWRSRAIDGSRVRPIYVHSKVAIVDDEWATIGSANLDSLAFEAGDEFPVRVERNVELNVAFRGAEVAKLRRRLWSEHLGDDVAWTTEPDGGWLTVWRERAQRDLEAWRRGDRMRGHVLPYLPPALVA